MALFTKRAVDVFAPTTAGGQPRGAVMGEAQTWGVEVEASLSGLAISATNYGLATGSSAAVNLAALKAAVAACPTGGAVVVPEGNYTIDCTGGLSAAATINKRMTLIVNGRLISNFGGQQANPPYLINVTADYVRIVGSGSFVGNGTVNYDASGDDETYAGLIRVSGDHFYYCGPIIEAAPRLGILLFDCQSATIADSTFIGAMTGWSLVSGSAYFAILSTGGSGHRISGNTFKGDGSGGNWINCIFSGGTAFKTERFIITENKAYAPYEKIVYVYTDESIIAGNYIEDANGTDAYRIIGSNNLITSNIARNCFGGTQTMDGVGNVISNNIFEGCEQHGIIVERLDAGYVGGFSGTKVLGNRVTAGAGTKTDGIRVLSQGADSTDIQVTENTVVGFTNSSSEAAIRVAGISPQNVHQVTIIGNNANGGQNAIILGRCINGLIAANHSNTTANKGIIVQSCADVEVSGNSLKSPGSYALSQTGCTEVRFLNNRSYGASNNGIEGVTGGVSVDNCYGAGNQYTDAPLAGQSTLSAVSATTTVTHGGVAPNAIIVVQGNSFGFAQRESTDGYYTAPTSGNFAVSNGNGNIAAGTETFRWQIIQ